MKKFKLCFDKNREMDWLNEMARQGWNLTKFGYGLYTFEPCTTGEYVYNCDLKDRAFSISPDYLSILESQNIQVIPSGGFWFLVRRKASDGPLQLYTDTESRLEQYRKIRRMFRATAIAELMILMFLTWDIAVMVPDNEPLIWTVMFLCALLVGAAALTLMNAVYQTSREIAKIQGKNEESHKCGQWLVAGGMLCMGLSILLRDCVPETVSEMVAGFALGLELVGALNLVFRKFS